MVSVTKREPQINIGENTAETRGTTVIVNAVALLRCFSVAEPVQGATLIAVGVGMHQSTVSRVLATLEQESRVERDADCLRYGLGLGLIAVAGPVLAELEEPGVACPVLRQWTEPTQETSALMAWHNHPSMCVEQIANPLQIRHATPPGASYRDAMSGSVQVLLAAQSEGRVR